MPMTLLEASKLSATNGEFYRAGIIQTYAETSDLLRVMPFQTIPNGAYTYSREQTLPGVGFRGINEGFTESAGVINPLTEKLVIAGGDLDVDKFLIDTNGEDVRGVHERMKAKALSHSMTKNIIKGDTDTDPRVLEGWQKRVA